VSAPALELRGVAHRYPDGTEALRSVELFETQLAPLVNCERPSRFTF
jgi:hypothetical protein